MEDHASEWCFEERGWGLGANSGVGPGRSPREEGGRVREGPSVIGPPPGRTARSVDVMANPIPSMGRRWLDAVRANAANPPGIPGESPRRGLRSRNASSHADRRERDAPSRSPDQWAGHARSLGRRGPLESAWNSFYNGRHQSPAAGPMDERDQAVVPPRSAPGRDPTFARGTVARMSTPTDRITQLLDEFRQARDTMAAELGKVVIGQHDVIEQIMAAVFTRGPRPASSASPGWPRR